MTDFEKLNALSIKELSILNHAESLYTGVVTTALNPLAYQTVHNEYLELQLSTNDSFVKNEALKRLIFLNWYYVSEPNDFTGISSLNEDTIASGYKLLDYAIENNLLDNEFKWMLSFYSDWDYIIFQFSEIGMPALTSFVKNADPSFKRPLKSELEITMNNRGQMGYYWKSINDPL